MSTHAHTHTSPPQTARYCDSACQKAHYKQGHKPVCKEIQQQRQASAAAAAASASAATTARKKNTNDKKAAAEDTTTSGWRPQAGTPAATWSLG